MLPPCEPPAKIAILSRVWVVLNQLTSRFSLRDLRFAILFRQEPCLDGISVADHMHESMYSSTSAPHAAIRGTQPVSPALWAGFVYCAHVPDPHPRCRILFATWAFWKSRPLPWDRFLVLGRFLTVPGPGNGLQRPKTTQQKRPLHYLASPGSEGPSPSPCVYVFVCACLCVCLCVIRCTCMHV